MSKDAAASAAKSDPTRNRPFHSSGSLRGPFFRDDDARLERVADAARRRADALAAERTARLSLKAWEAVR